MTDTTTLYGSSDYVHAERIDAARLRLTSATDRDLFERAYAEAMGLPHTVQAVVLEALALVGLQPAMLEYQARLFPRDTIAQARQMALKMSSCGLTRETCLDTAGIAGQWTGVAYASRIGSALSAEIIAAKKAGAWVDVAGGAAFDPHPGDGVVIGCSSCPGVWGKGGFSMEHVLGVVLVDGDMITSVDGGQPGILLRTREIRTMGRETWLATVGCPMDSADGRPTKGRRVLGHSNLAAWSAATNA